MQGVMNLRMGESQTVNKQEALLSFSDKYEYAWILRQTDLLYVMFIIILISICMV